MADITWHFAPSNGGRDAGINDPGLQTFKDDFYRYLAREMIQNSLDARLDPNKPVEVIFDLEEIGKSDIPDLKSLRLALMACTEFWSTQKKTVGTFQRALATFEGRVVSCLRVSDGNTRGVGGSDTDRNGDWYNLVRCAGSSAKGEGEGGSFGIGKNAPFAASEARTVLYSTRTADRSVAFQGVSLLATHEDSNGEKRQPTGFLGGPESAAIRDESQIPERFRKKTQGTDVWIIGYAASDQWQADLIFSVLDSFWPAIQFGELIVSVGGIKISAENLESKLLEYSTRTDFTGYAYYQAYKNPIISDRVVIKDLGECFIYINSDEAFSRKRFAMIRKTGMVITHRPFRSPMPFSGVFLCRNDKGNSRLREMEPPRHDQWSADLPDPGAGRKIVDSIGEYVRQSLRKLTPEVEAQQLSIPGLEKFLPDATKDNSTGLWTGSESSSTESAEHLTVISDVKPIVIRKARPTSPQVEADDALIDLDGGEATEVEDFGEQEREPGEGGTRTTRKDGGEKPGDHAKGPKPKAAIPVRYRSFLSDRALGRYSLTVTPEAASDQAILSAYAVGDDQRSVIPISSARLASGEALEVHNGVIGPLALEADTVLKIEMFLDTRLRYALEVMANEAD